MRTFLPLDAESQPGRKYSQGLRGKFQVCAAGAGGVFLPQQQSSVGLQCIGSQHSAQ